MRRDEVVAGGLARAAFEASTEYSWVGARPPPTSACMWARAALQADGARSARARNHGNRSLCAPLLPGPVGPMAQMQEAGGAVAMGIRRELPWLKLVVSMREPISAEISGLVHRMGAC